MRTIKLFEVGLTLGVGSLLCSAALAQQGPAKELEKFKSLVGTWACENRTLGEGGYPFKSSWEFKAEYDGNTYVHRWQEQASEQHRQPAKDISLWSFDSKSGRYVQIQLDHQGNLSQLTSDPAGWTGVYPFGYVWAGEGFRLPIVRKSPNEWTWVAEIAEGDRWVAVAEGTCRK